MRMSASAPRKSRAWLPSLGWYHNSSQPARSACAISIAQAGRSALQLSVPAILSRRLVPAAATGWGPSSLFASKERLRPPVTVGLTPLAKEADTCCNLRDTMRTPATLAFAELLAGLFADKFAMRK